MRLPYIAPLNMPLLMCSIQEWTKRANQIANG